MIRVHPMKRLPLVFLVAACGSSSTKTPDAHVADAPPDMPVVDAFLPDSPEPVGGHYHYVISKMTWPTSNSEARADAFDLDNDGQLDNQLGMVMATFNSQGFPVQPATDKSIATGQVIMLGDLGATDLTTDTLATFTLYTGTDPNPPACNGSADTTCGHHLHGTATFTVDPSAPTDTPLAGPIATGTFTGGPGHLTIEASLLGSTPISLTLLGAHARLAVTTGGFMQGIIGGGITDSDIQTKVYPAITTGLNAQVAHDCSALQSPPQCGCTSGSTGATDISLFDANHDCTITVSEVQNNSLIMSLFMPDVTLENMQCLSAGFAVQAVDATFTP